MSVDKSSRFYSNDSIDYLTEQVLVNDGSMDIFNFNPFWTKFNEVETESRRERLFAINMGLKEVSNDWVVLLDSDDELLPHAFDVFAQMIEKYPKYKLFNFESIHIHRNCKTNIRGAFRPKPLEVGHEVFGGGNIVNGTFIFHKSLMGDNIDEFLPPFGNPWDFSIHAQKEFPEIKPLFTVTNEDHPKGHPKELGNPWGQDFYMFYKLTRKNHSKAFDVPLVIIHHEGKEEDGKHYIE